MPAPRGHKGRFCSDSSGADEPWASPILSLHTAPRWQLLFLAWGAAVTSRPRDILKWGGELSRAGEGGEREFLEDSTNRKKASGSLQCWLDGRTSIWTELFALGKTALPGRLSDMGRWYPVYLFDNAAALPHLAVLICCRSQKDVEGGG